MLERHVLPRVDLQSWQALAQTCSAFRQALSSSPALRPLAQVSNAVCHACTAHWHRPTGLQGSSALCVTQQGVQAQLSGSLDSEPAPAPAPEPEPESEPEAECSPGADLRQQLNQLARLFTALRQGASPALLREALLRADALGGECEYAPSPCMLSPSGHAAAVPWVRFLSSSDSDSSENSSDEDSRSKRERGLQMVVLGPSGTWDTAAIAGGQGWLRPICAEHGKGWSPDGRYFLSALISEACGLPGGKSIQIFDTARGWLRERYLDNDDDENSEDVDSQDFGAAQPHQGDACFSDEGLLAAARICDVRRDCSGLIAIFGPHQPSTHFVPVPAGSGGIQLAWLPGTTRLVIMGAGRLACISASSDGTVAEPELEWYGRAVVASGAPASCYDAMHDIWTNRKLAAAQPRNGQHLALVLYCRALAGNIAEFHLALYSAVALGDGQLSFVTEFFDDPGKAVGCTRETEFSLHASAQSVAACLGNLLGTWVYPLDSDSQLGSCLFHKPGLYRLSFEHGGRFVVGILSGLAAVLCGLTGATLLQVDVNRFCHVPEPVTAACAVLVKGHLHVAACTPLLNGWLCSGVHFSSFQL